MALMPRSKGKGKGPAHKKGRNGAIALKAKATPAKRKAKQRKQGRGAGSMDVELTTRPQSGIQKKKVAPGKKAAAALAIGGGDDDDFEDMLSDDGSLGEEGAEALATEIEGSAPADGSTAAAAKSLNQKKKERKKKVKQRTAAADFEASRAAAAAVADAEPSGQADWLWASYTAAMGAPDDQRGAFDGSFIASLAGAGSLEERLKAAAGPQWQQHLGLDASRPNGAPSVILVAASAVGANDLIKRLPSLHQACKVAKLFAKHIKVAEQQALLTRSAPALAVGTPHRLSQLAAMGALKLDRLQLLLVDVALDAKQRTILDVPETRKDFWAFFTQHWAARLAARQMRVGLFNSQDA